MIRRYALVRAISMSTCFGLVFGAPAPAVANEYDLTPHLRVNRNTHPDSDFTSPTGGYVRFSLQRVRPNQRCAPPASAAMLGRNYRQEARDPLTRLFWGRSHSRVLQASLTVTRSGIVAQTVTLASASHDSNSRAGEAWTSEATSQVVLTPYIRVDQGTKIAIQVQMRATRETDPAVTANLLSIVRAGADLVVPGSTLVTSLNSARLNKGSNFIDDTLKSLFRESLGETERFEFPSNRWFLRNSVGDVTLATGEDCSPGRAIAGIAADFPMGSHVWRDDGLRDVGEWHLFASEPHVSVFSDVTPLEAPAIDPVSTSIEGQCLSAPGGKSEPLRGHDRQACIAFIGLTPSTVLGFAVAENVSLGQSLRGDSGISAALQRFGNATQHKDEAANTAAREICVLVAERAEALGLNPYDAAAALWAFASNGGISSQVSSRIWEGNCTLSRLAKRVHLDLETDSAASAPPTTPTTPTPTPTPIP